MTAVETSAANSLVHRAVRHTGSVASAVAVLGFAIGSYGAYRLVDKPPTAQILLRQATEPERMSTFDGIPGAGGVLVLLRNDSTSPVVVIDAAFSRTSAAPPLYIAPASVPPGGEVNVYVAVPGKCFSSGIFVAPGPTPPPVRITVSAQLPGGSLQFVPVEVTGELAQIIAQCGPAANS